MPQTTGGECRWAGALLHLDAHDTALLAKRKILYNQAMAANPSRWCRRTTRNWTPVTATSLTPTDDREIERIYKCA
jgi:hypothetical protein